MPVWLLLRSIMSGMNWVNGSFEYSPVSSFGEPGLDGIGDELAIGVGLELLPFLPVTLNIKHHYSCYKLVFFWTEVVVRCSLQMQIRSILDTDYRRFGSTVL